LSGSAQGAGGVGGLLEVTYHGTAATNAFVAYDGNGNVAALVNAGDGTLLANYDYGPFGEVIRQTGPMAKVNPIRFSTKYQDDESDLLYYGYRYYKPSTGTWLTRDPAEETGGKNLYGFTGNAPVQFVDAFGLDWKVLRTLGPRAIATCDCGDTWDDLARKIHFDVSDRATWAQTADQAPVAGKIYQIPNTIYVDYGSAKPGDYYPFDIFWMWQSVNDQAVAKWQSQGFRVVTDVGVIDKDIVNHLGSADIYGYVFTGHGWNGAIINTYSATDPGNVGTGPDRYTQYGIAFMNLNACDSADSVPVIRRNYTYNAWESNVSKRGWFKGYTGSVNTIDELFLWVVTHGKNDHGYRFP